MDGRPFANQNEMDETLIENWNAVVKKYDDVYVLGDFFHHSRRHDMADILLQLHGKIHLIIGNHDEYLVKALKNGKLPQAASQRIDVLGEIKLLNYQKRKLILCHYPLPTYPGRFHTRNDENLNTYMLYGHVHTTGEYDMIRQLIAEQETPMQMINVGTMVWEYRPVNIEEILKIQ